MVQQMIDWASPESGAHLEDRVEAGPELAMLGAGGLADPILHRGWGEAVRTYAVVVAALVETEVAVGRKICEFQTEPWLRTQAVRGRRQDVETEAHVAQSPDFGPHKNSNGDEKAVGREGDRAVALEVKVVLSRIATPSVTLQVSLQAKEAAVALDRPA